MHLSNESLRSSELYTPGLSREFVARKWSVPLDEVAKLGSAENPFGPSPKALDAVLTAAQRIDIYPEWTAAPLREAIGARYGFDPRWVICGAGETEILSWLIRAYAGPGEKVLMYEPCFPIYFMAAEADARVPVSVPMGSTFEFRVDRYIEALTDDIRIAFITHPHSPSGKLMDEADIRRICEASRGKLLVLDEAYIHFTRTDGCMHLAREFDHVIVLRTFSKAFGLAGLRAGFGIAHPDILRPLMAIKPTWNMGQMQIAGAMAALGDNKHVERTVQMICEMREHVTERMASLKNFRIVGNSRANFFMVEILASHMDSTGVFDALLSKGVVVKDCSVSFRGLGKRYLRVDVSLQQHMDRFVDALSDLDAP
ncbi:MAG: histidinol-phosphate transaminase [Burkholderiaceae bacterium]